MAGMVAAFASPLTCSGRELPPMLVPFASWPLVFSPHDHTVPSFFNASAN